MSQPSIMRLPLLPGSCFASKTYCRTDCLSCKVVLTVTAGTLSCLCSFAMPAHVSSVLDITPTSKLCERAAAEVERCEAKALTVTSLSVLHKCCCASRGRGGCAGCAAPYRHGGRAQPRPPQQLAPPPQVWLWFRSSRGWQQSRCRGSRSGIWRRGQLPDIQIPHA